MSEVPNKQVDADALRGEGSKPLLAGEQRSRFLADYLRAKREVDKAHPGYSERARAFAEEFIDYPGRFRPTAHAVRTPYYEFVIKPAGAFCNVSQVGSPEFPMQDGAIRNVRVGLAHRYSSTIGDYAPIVLVLAEVRQQNGSYRQMSDGGVCFNLSDWVERIPDEELE
jgi:hypothetical protein